MAMAAMDGWIWLDLVDDEEAWEDGAAVEDDELAVAHVDGVVIRGVAGMAVLVLRGTDAAGDDAAHQHRPAARAGAGAGVRGAAPGERAHRGVGGAEAAGGDARAEHPAGPRAARHWNRIISLPSAPHRAAAPWARRRPGLLEPRHRPRAAVDAEHRSTVGPGAAAPHPTRR